MQLKYQQKNNVKEAYQAVKGKINQAALAKMNITADIQCQDDRPAIVAKGKGFTVTISFHADHCVCDIDLSILLRPLKGRIEDSLKKEILSAI